MNEQTNLVSNLEAYYESGAPPSALQGSPSARANKTISSRRALHGEKTISKAAQAKLPTKAKKK